MKTYRVLTNCSNGLETVLRSGSTVELPNERVNESLLQILLNQSALIEVVAVPEVAPEAPPSEQQARRTSPKTPSN
jgi:hypothetical protein